MDNRLEHFIKTRYPGAVSPLKSYSLVCFDCDYLVEKAKLLRLPSGEAFIDTFIDKIYAKSAILVSSTTEEGHAVGVSA